MNSGRIAIGFVLVLALATMFMFKASTLPIGYSVGTSDNDSTSASVTVNGYVSVTLSNVTISFPALDPGINNTPATNNAMQISIDQVTNTGTMVYINGSNFNGSGDSFNVQNMTYNITATGTATANTSCTTTRCKYGATPFWVLNETKPGAAAKTESIGHYISVPVAQTAGTYQANVRVCTQQQQASIICV